MDAMLFRQNTRNTGNNAIEISQAFHESHGLNISQIYTCSKLGNRCFKILLDGTYFLLAVMTHLWQKEMNVAS